MMAWVFGGFILAGVILGFVSGTPGAIVDSLIQGASDAVTLCISLAGAYMLWMGLMRVAQQSGMIDSLSRRMRPLIRFLIPGAGSATAPITLNLAANFLGMGNAATPFGLAAMQELNRSNPRPGRATDAMCMFLCINASSIQLIPTTVISLRVAAGSADPYAIVLPTLIATLICAVSAVMLCRLLAPLFP
ncbi:MAG: nucleoside recognition domain-containing protein [Bacillota bacterium]